MSAQLKRELHFWDSVAINVGIIVGVGIFRVPSEIAKHIDSVWLTFLGWAAGALIALVGVLCYAELSSRIPETGGTYAFLRKAYGKPAAFLYGWTEVAVLRAASIAAVAYVFSDYLVSLISIPIAYSKPIAILATLALTLVNIAGVRSSANFQRFMSFGKVAALVFLALLIFWFGQKVHQETAGQSISTLSVRSWSETALLFGTALIPILFTYGGWHESTFMSGEFRDHKKELPISLIVSVAIVAALYLLVNAAYLWIFPPAEMIHHEAVATSALDKIFGFAGKQMTGCFVVISTLGALNSNILTGGRIPFAMAQDAKRLEWLGAVNERFFTPHRALLLNGLWASALILWGTFEQLLFFSGFALRLFFALIALSVFVVRRREPAHEGFLMWGYPFIPALFFVLSILLCVLSVRYAPQASLIGLGLILLGIPVYFISRGPNREKVLF